MVGVAGNPRTFDEVKISMTIRFCDVTPDNWRILNALKVKEEQKGFVASSITILARAYAFREFGSRVYGVYDGNVPIGVLMQREHKDGDKLQCILDQFMIAEQFQGRGYGRAAMKLWISMMEKEEKCDSILLCYKESDEPARNLYLSLGFYHNGQADEDEIVMEYDLRSIGGSRDGK